MHCHSLIIVDVALVEGHGAIKDIGGATPLQKNDEIIKASTLSTMGKSSWKVQNASSHGDNTVGEDVATMEIHLCAWSRDGNAASLQTRARNKLPIGRWEGSMRKARTSEARLLWIAQLSKVTKPPETRTPPPCTEIIRASTLSGQWEGPTSCESAHRALQPHKDQHIACQQKAITPSDVSQNVQSASTHILTQPDATQTPPARVEA